MSAVDVTVLSSGQVRVGLTIDPALGEALWFELSPADARELAEQILTVYFQTRPPPKADG